MLVNCKYQAISFFKSLLLDLLRRNICWYFQHTLAFSRGHDGGCSTNAALIAVPQHRVLAVIPRLLSAFLRHYVRVPPPFFLINGLDKLACSEEMK